MATALNFPSSPTLGQTYTENQKIWKWDGSAWVSASSFYLSPADLLTQIKTVDGINSGLDADLLDDQHGSYYLDWNNTTNKPNTLDGYGITDALSTSGNNNTISGSAEIISFTPDVTGNEISLLFGGYTFLHSGNYSNYVQPVLVSGTNIKTINGNSILGSGDLTISGGSGGGITTGKAIAMAMVFG